MDRPSPSTSTDPYSVGWITSLILHGMLAFGAFLFTQQITLAPQPTPFKWNVSMVAPSSMMAPPDAERSAPGHQAQFASASTAKRPAPVVATVAEPVQAKIETAVQPTEPITPIVEKRTSTPAPPRPIAEPNPHPVAEQTPVPRTTETTDQTVTHAEPVVPVTPPAAPSSQHASTVQASDPPHPAPPSPVPSAPSQPVSSRPVESEVSAHTETVPLPKEPPLHRQAADSSESQVASLSPASQTKSAKANYGWLADLMAKWIDDLDKHYPAMLRTEGIQGKVTLSALLHEDGMLSDVRVAKSSGNALLDQVAVEDIKNGPPVRLSRPLERAQMPVKFSIIYDLKTAP